MSWKNLELDKEVRHRVRRSVIYDNHKSIIVNYESDTRVEKEDRKEGY